MKNRIVLFVILSLLLLFVTIPATARQFDIYTSFHTAGHTMTTASAATGVALDEGILSLWRNPAGLVRDRHELMGDGVIRGAISTQTAADPAEWKAAVGMVGYLYSFDHSVLALAYTPRNHVQLSADYPYGTSVNRIEYSEWTASYASKLGRGWSAGVSAGAIAGEGRDGFLTNEAAMDTVYRPLLWFGRLGVRYKGGIMRYGLAVETPAFGNFTVEQPVNVGYQRTEDKYDFSGAWGVRAGIGWDLRFMALETDLLYYNTNSVDITPPGFAEEAPDEDGTAVSGEGFDDPLISMGVTAQMQINDQIRIRSGARIRWSDPQQIRFVLGGLGGEYKLSSDLLVYVSGGLMVPYGDGVDDTVYSDLRPFVLRGGVIYHSDIE